MVLQRLFTRRSPSPSVNRGSIMSTFFLVKLLLLIQAVVGDNRTEYVVDLQLRSPTHDTAESMNMQSSGFLDLSLLEFTSLDDETTIDIAVFVEPQNLSSYYTIGIGNQGGEVCCSTAARKAGACATAGRLNINQELFEGVLLSVAVPAMRNVSINPYDVDPVLFIEKEGSYSLLFANCNDNTTTVDITGLTIWDSLVTEGDIEDSVPFYVALTVAYFALLAWFAYLMYENQSSRVRLEEYIFAVIVLGFMETLFATIDYALEARHLIWLTITTIFFETCKNGLARCVLMMVSLGWGVTVASLHYRTMVMILVLGSSYAALAFTVDMAQIKQGAGVEEGNVDDDVSTYTAPVKTVASILSTVVLIIWIWIIFCLNVTIKYLEDNQQERKLQRYKWLLHIMILAVIMNILAILFITMEIADGLNVNITVWPATTEAGFFLVVACVAYLWRPNPNAREYAYVEELNTENYELELNEDSPSVLQEDNNGIAMRELT
jgi:hypothetical protein